MIIFWMYKAPRSDVYIVGSDTNEERKHNFYLTLSQIDLLSTQHCPQLQLTICDQINFFLASYCPHGSISLRKEIQLNLFCTMQWENLLICLINQSRYDVSKDEHIDSDIYNKKHHSNLLLPGVLKQFLAYMSQTRC